jgi:hypothetical protein
MSRRLALLSLLVVSCSRHIAFDVVTNRDGREFKVTEQVELPEYKAGCALRVAYLTDEDDLAAIRAEAEQLAEVYYGDKRADRCRVILMQADRLLPRLGGLFSETRHSQVLFDMDEVGHWRRTPSLL